MPNRIETHGDVLRLARRTMDDHNWTLINRYRAGDYSFGADDKDKALAVIRNYDDAIRIIDEDLLPEEIRWESENGITRPDHNQEEL